MRAARMVMLCIVVVTVFLCWCNSVCAGPSLWPTSKGEICLHNITTDQYVKLDVLRTVGNSYVVQGLVTETPPDKNSLFNGNAIVDGNKILLYISSAGYTGDLNSNVTQFFGFMGRVELDANTLKGSAVGVEYSCSGTAQAQCLPFQSTGIHELEPTSTCP